MPKEFAPPKGFSANTSSWVKTDESNSSYIEIYPKQTILRSLPKSIDETIDWRFEKGYLGNQFETPPVFLAIIPSGRVWSSNGVVITPDNMLLADVSVEFGVLSENAGDHSIFKKVKLPPLIEVKGNIAVLAAIGGHSYFHWMFDVLPRIELLKNTEMFAKIDKYIVNKISSDFQVETLKMLSIDSDKIIEADENTHIKAEKLIVPSLPGITGSMTGWACTFLRDNLLRRDLLKERNNYPCYIYITRRNSKYRRVLNEDDLLNLLTPLGFEMIFLENLSIMEQALLFSSAQVIVAPHGAGLSNLVFSTPGTKVIEIFSPKYVNPCYRALCNLINLDYWYLLGEGEVLPIGAQEHLRDFGGEDIQVNLKSVSLILARVV